MSTIDEPTIDELKTYIELSKAGPNRDSWAHELIEKAIAEIEGLQEKHRQKDDLIARFTKEECACAHRYGGVAIHFPGCPELAKQQIAKLEAEVERLRALVPEWAEFDPCKQLDGELMCVFGKGPDYDGDVDDYGRMVGRQVGEVDYTAVAYVFYDDEGTEVDVQFGEWDNEAHITHIARFRLPPPPESKS